MLVNVNTIYGGGSSGRNLYDSQERTVLRRPGASPPLASGPRASGAGPSHGRDAAAPDPPGAGIRTVGRYGVQLGGEQTKTATLFTLTPPIFGNFPTAAR